MGLEKIASRILQLLALADHVDERIEERAGHLKTDSEFVRNLAETYRAAQSAVRELNGNIAQNKTRDLLDNLGQLHNPLVLPVKNYEYFHFRIPYNKLENRFYLATFVGGPKLKGEDTLGYHLEDATEKIYDYLTNPSPRKILRIQKILFPGNPSEVKTEGVGSKKYLPKRFEKENRIIREIEKTVDYRAKEIKELYKNMDHDELTIMSSVLELYPLLYPITDEFVGIILGNYKTGSFKYRKCSQKETEGVLFNDFLYAISKRTKPDRSRAINALRTVKLPKRPKEMEIEAAFRAAIKKLANLKSTTHD